MKSNADVTGYDAVAEKYDEFYGDALARAEDVVVIEAMRRANWRTTRKVADVPHLPTQSVHSVLDLGCGSGQAARLLKRAGVAMNYYVGVDLSIEMLKRWTSSIDVGAGRVVKLERPEANPSACGAVQNPNRTENGFSWVFYDYTYGTSIEERVRIDVFEPPSIKHNYLEVHVVCASILDALPLNVEKDFTIVVANWCLNYLSLGEVVGCLQRCSNYAADNARLVAVVCCKGFDGCEIQKSAGLKFHANERLGERIATETDWNDVKSTPLTGPVCRMLRGRMYKAALLVDHALLKTGIIGYDDFRYVMIEARNKSSNCNGACTIKKVHA